MANDALDVGFGLVEVLVSMFLLAILSIAFLPLLIDALRATVRSSTITTASQVLAQQLDRVPTLERTCAALDAFEAEPDVMVVDDRGTEYRGTREVSACPTGTDPFPALLTVTLRVAVVDQPDLLIETETFTIVEAAS